MGRLPKGHQASSLSLMHSAQGPCHTPGPSLPHCGLQASGGRSLSPAAPGAPSQDQPYGGQGLPRGPSATSPSIFHDALTPGSQPEAQQPIPDVTVDKTFPTVAWHLWSCPFKNGHGPLPLGIPSWLFPQILPDPRSHDGCPEQSEG